jgi:hypothetical protein
MAQLDRQDSCQHHERHHQVEGQPVSIEALEAEERQRDHQRDRDTSKHPFVPAAQFAEAHPITGGDRSQRGGHRHHRPHLIGRVMHEELEHVTCLVNQSAHPAMPKCIRDPYVLAEVGVSELKPSCLSCA